MFRNKFFLYALIFSATLILFANGCESNESSGLTNAELSRIANTENIELVESAGNPVLMVGGEYITSEEIIEEPVALGERYISPLEYLEPIARVIDLEQFKERAGPLLKEIVTQKISDILLYQHAKRQAGSNVEESLENLAESELNNFMSSYGGDQAKADEVLRQSGETRESFKEKQKRAILVRWYVKSQMQNNSPISYRQLRDQYEMMKDEYFKVDASIQFQLIDIQPAKLQLQDPNEDPWKAAEKLANELLARIKSGEDFGELAKQFSNGHMKEFSGLWQPVKPSSLSARYEKVVQAARQLDPGQVSDIIKSDDRIFIVKLINKQTAGYEPFEKVQDQVRKAVLIERQNAVIKKLNARVMQQTQFGEADSFVDFCLEKIYRISNQ